MERTKMYVTVIAEHKANGKCHPSMVILADGQRFEIDRVRHCCRAASTKVGGTGIRYTVSICGQGTFLFDEENGKWFVEAKKN